MFPKFAAQDVGDARHSYTKLLRELGGGSALGMKVSREFDVTLRKFGVGVLAASVNKFRIQPVAIPVATRAAASYDFVSHIIEVIAKAKVFLSHAGAHVAGVQNEFPNGVFSVVNQVRYSVGAHAHPVDVKNAVASFSECGSPDPAFSLRAVAGGLVNFFPESLKIRLREGWNCSRLSVRHLSFPINGTCLGSDAARKRHPGPFLFYPLPV
jgi:hypothetical protein